MNPRHEECAEWLHKARNDLLSARILIANAEPVTDTACFHCRHAVEMRYPGDLLDVPSPEAQEALASTEDIILFLAERFPQKLGQLVKDGCCMKSPNDGFNQEEIS